MPTVSFLMLPLMLPLESPINIAVAFVVLSSASAAIAYWLGEKYGYVRVILGLVSINLFVQIADIVTGGNLQFNSLFGYSAIVAGRFAGFGNLAFSIVSISAVLFVAMIKELSSTRLRWKTKWVNLGVLGVLISVLIVDGAPNFGSDVGGVLAITPMIFITGLMLYNKRISIKSLFVAAAVTLGAITVFSLFDLNRPVAEQTHLGRFVKVLLDGQAGVVIERKILANFLTLTNSVLASVIILGTLFCLYLFTQPERFLKEASRVHPSIPYIVYPGLVLGMLGMFLNDSGVAIPGMMMAVAFPAIVLLTFEKRPLSQYDTTLADESV